MTIDQKALHGRLEGLKFGNGLTRDQIREQLHELPDDVCLHLPAIKPFLSADDVLEYARSARTRADGEFVRGELDIPVEGATEDFGPPAYGDSLSPGNDLVEGQGDYPGELDDIGGNSIATAAGRGVPDEEQ